MFWRKVPRENLGLLFKDTFQRITSILYREKDLVEIHNNLGHELYAFLFSTSIFYATRFNKALRDAAVHDLVTVCDSMFATMNNAYFQRRQDFYARIARSGQIRNEWFLSNFPDQPDIRMYIAFGDCLYNADCVNDYIGAPVSIRDFTDKISFNKMMLQIQDILQEYCKSVSKL